LAENGELELPNAGEYTAKDYAIAVELYLSAVHANAVSALTNGEPGELRNMAKYLMRHCDMSRCDSPALPDDIFCAHHRDEENALMYQQASKDDLPF
jgi:hypothetical protein